MHYVISSEKPQTQILKMTQSSWKTVQKHSPTFQIWNFWVQPEQYRLILSCISLSIVVGQADTVRMLAHSSQHRVEVSVNLTELGPVVSRKAYFPIASLSTTFLSHHHGLQNKHRRLLPRSHFDLVSSSST